jgi:hypothetical protein
MDAKEITQGLMSTDRDNVVRASWEIIHSNDPHVLQVVSDQLPAISGSVKTLSPNSEPALRDYRFAPALAVEILTCFNPFDGRRCSLYPASNSVGPEEEEHLGFTEITKEEDHLEACTIEYHCICTHCENRYEVMLHESCHYPLWYWEKLRV